MAPIHHTCLWVRSHRILTVVYDNIGLPLFQVPDLVPRCSAVVRPSKTTLETIRVVWILRAIAVESREAGEPAGEEQATILEFRDLTLCPINCGDIDTRCTSNVHARAHALTPFIHPTRHNNAYQVL